MDFDESDCVISIFHESFMKAKHFLKICLPFRWNCEVQAPAEACEEARGAGAQVGGPPGKGEVRQGRQVRLLRHIFFVTPLMPARVLRFGCATPVGARGPVHALPPVSLTRATVTFRKQLKRSFPT